MPPTQSGRDRGSAFPHLCFVFFISLLTQLTPFILSEGACVSHCALPTASNAARGEEMGLAGVSLEHVSPGSSLQVCPKPAQGRRCRLTGRSWGRALCTCGRSCAEADGNGPVSSRPGTAVAPGEFVPHCRHCCGEREHEGGRSLPAAAASLSPGLPLTSSSPASARSTNSSFSDTGGSESQTCRGAGHREAATR